MQNIVSFVGSFAKETYNFKEPTTCRNIIKICVCDVTHSSHTHYVSHTHTHTRTYTRGHRHKHSRAHTHSHGRTRVCEILPNLCVQHYNLCVRHGSFIQCDRTHLYNVTKNFHMCLTEAAKDTHVAIFTFECTYDMKHSSVSCDMTHSYSVTEHIHMKPETRMSQHSHMNAHMTRHIHMCRTT